MCVAVCRCLLLYVAVCCLLSLLPLLCAVSCLPFVVRCLLFVVRCSLSLFVVGRLYVCCRCCSLFVVWLVILVSFVGVRCVLFVVCCCCLLFEVVVGCGLLLFIGCCLLVFVVAVCCSLRLSLVFGRCWLLLVLLLFVAGVVCGC